MNNKGNSPLLNGVILAAVLVYLCVYFSMNGMWNIATIFVAILIAMLSVGQVLIYIFFFKEPMLIGQLIIRNHGKISLSKLR